MSEYQRAGHFQKWVVDAFQQAYPNIKLGVTPATTSTVQLKTLLAGGTPPDLTSYADPDKYLSKLMVSLTDRVKRDKLNTSVFAKDAFESGCVWRGAIFALPQHGSGGGGWPVMPYNRDLFRQYGVAEPPAKWGDPSWNARTWQEALQKTTRVSPDGQPLSFGLNEPSSGFITHQYAGMWKAAWLSEDLRTVTCDTPQMAEAIDYLVGLSARHGVIASESRLKEAFGVADQHQAFFTGKLAMHYSAGPRTVILVTQAVREQGLPVAFAPLPTFATFGAAHYMRGHGLVTGGRQPEAAWTFLKWMTETPNYPISRGEPPARADFFDAWAKELYSGIGTQMRLDVYRDTTRYYARRDPITVLPNYSELADTVIEPALTKVRTGAATAAVALREIKPQLQALIPKDLA